MKKFHYVYLIEEISTEMKYIGSRSSDVEPAEDLGKKYFSSSTVKAFLKRQKEKPEDYKYTVLQTFNTRKETNDSEFALLVENNIRSNPKFYNKGIIKDGIFADTDNIQGIMVAYDNVTDRHVRLHRDEYHANKDRYCLPQAIKKGYVCCTDTATNEVVRIPTSEFRANKDRYKGVNKPTGASNPKAKRIRIYDENGNLRYEVKGGLKKLCAEHNMPYPAMYLSHQNGGRKIGLTSTSRGELKKTLKHYYVGWYALSDDNERTDFQEPDCDINEVRYSGLLSSLGREYMAKGQFNSNAKIIEIYNSEHQLMYTCNGDFNKVVKENGLPASMKLSYLTNTKVHSCRKGSPFHNWYAVLKS